MLPQNKVATHHTPQWNTYKATGCLWV